MKSCNWFHLQMKRDQGQDAEQLAQACVLVLPGAKSRSPEGHRTSVPNVFLWDCHANLPDADLNGQMTSPGPGGLRSSSAFFSHSVTFTPTVSEKELTFSRGFVGAHIHQPLNKGQSCCRLPTARTAECAGKFGCMWPWHALTLGSCSPLSFSFCICTMGAGILNRTP